MNRPCPGCCVLYSVYLGLSCLASLSAPLPMLEPQGRSHLCSRAGVSTEERMGQLSLARKLVLPPIPGHVSPPSSLENSILAIRERLRIDTSWVSREAPQTDCCFHHAAVVCVWSSHASATSPGAVIPGVATCLVRLCRGHHAGDHFIG